MDEKPTSSRSAESAACICERCGQPGQTGQNYRFYYGKYTDNSILDWILRLRRTGSPPLIAGHTSAWLCRSCVHRRAGIRYGFLAITSSLVLAAIGAILSDIQVNSLVLPLAILLLGLAFVVAPPMAPKEIAERMAIGLKRKVLRAQGHTLFLTDSQFMKLR